MDGNTNIPSISLPSGEQQSVQTSITGYFVIKHTDSLSDSSFKKTSPFLIAKTSQSVLGDGHSLKKLQSGDLLVEVSSARQSQLLSNCNTIGTFSVSVKAHQTLNTCRGVISEPDLLFSTKEELLANLSDQNIIDVRRITIRQNGLILPTKHIILTFNSHILPTRIKAGYLNCPDRPYIPNPLRCFKCQHYGHTNTTYRGTVTCARCAEVGHDGKTCKKPERCANCKGDHTSYSRPCPNWIREKEILAVKIAQKLSYPEARKQVESRTPSVGVSYSSILKEQSKPVRHISTQTDTSFPPSNSAKTQSTTTSNKETCDICCGSKCYAIPKLERWLPSSKPVIIEYQTSQSQKPPVHPKKSSKLQVETMAVKPKKSLQKPDTSKTVKPSKKTCGQKETKTIRVSSQWNTVKKKNRPNPSGTNVKDPKQLQKYVDEAMEMESKDSSVDDENTVFT